MHGKFPYSNSDCFSYFSVVMTSHHAAIIKVTITARHFDADLGEGSGMIKTIAGRCNIGVCLAGLGRSSVDLCFYA